MPDLANLAIKVEARWEKAEPDYDVVCKCCGDQVFGEHFQLFVKIAENRPEKVEGYRICPGCEAELARRHRPNDNDQTPPDHYTPD
jgi:hypothetical protein